MKLVTASQMRRIEDNAVKFGVSKSSLMENAGVKAAEFICSVFDIAGLSITIFAGRGGNGGDGCVVARKLCELGANVTVILVDGLPSNDLPFAVYNDLLDKGIKIFNSLLDKICMKSIARQSDIIVDAISGIGFIGSLKPNIKEACDAINSVRYTAPIVSLDIPTGIECDTSAYDPHAVRADYTIVFDSLKPAHLLPKSNPLCGVVHVVEIGISDKAAKSIAGLSGILTEEQVFSKLLPRAVNSHKGVHGRLLNISGSLRYRGAASLSCIGALRAGVGLCFLASTDKVCDAVAALLPEVIFCPLPDDGSGVILAENLDELIREELAAAKTVLLGCGLGDGQHAKNLLEYVLTNAKCPVVIDADGLNALARNMKLLKNADMPIILTPHLGEMARLCDATTEDISADKSGYASRFAKEHSVTLVLKGNGTLIATSDGKLWLNPTGNPGLAKGGSGDVLAGIIASFAAQGVNADDACLCGVFLHGLAADKSSERRGEYAMLPSELGIDLAEILAASGR
ncbi:MAG: NAD(P)H-hydrate dehydratase [Defluviitaleaceae bacterium]|nr:NAD(P)H-hydrate dehydratase [Defluviitaleaceae bacterium]